ncbi:uncharacterized protein PRCAT00002240001 [Priceomyces carsonii]|uniref:uncharacterized protein n=1 Tax=Priceomyces carsonii TaxID=28549 RepID=UPI002ED9CBDF|nr:unnamed protein product [Priceomyces carsonii]
MLSRISTRAYSGAAHGIKINAKGGSTELSSLTLRVNNAGSKEGKSGVAHLLAKHSFLNTEPKSALRFTREAELLGALFSSNVTRDAIVLKTQFLKEDLPYFVEALGNVLTKTSFRPYELPEIVLPAAKEEYDAAHADNAFTALESLHELSFRKGLGHPLYYDGSSNVTADDLQEFAAKVYTSENVSLHALGVDQDDLSLFVGESALSSLPTGSTASPSVSFHVGKESRIRATGKSAALIGVPVKPADFGKYEILSAAVGSAFLPGAETPLSKIPGATSQLYKYQDAGLFVVSVTGSASDVTSGIKAAKKVLQSVSSSSLSDATKAAKLAVALQSTYDSIADVQIGSSSPVKFDSFNYVAIGNVDVLPYADEL